MNFWRFFYYMYPMYPTLAAAVAKHSTQQYQRHTRACVTWKWSLWDANDFCVVGRWDALQFCTFDLHTPGMSAVAAAAAYRHPCQINDQQMSRSIPQPLQLDISRKTAKTVPLKLSKYLYKNTFYNYAEQLVGFSLNCCTRECPQPIVENIWYWTWGYFVPPCTNV